MTLPVKQLSDLNPGGTGLGQSAADLISFYGFTPISQRANAVQAASLVSANSWISVTSNMGAFASEVCSALTALGLWKGGA